MNYYECLDVARDASKDQIKKAFRTKAKKYHPDAGGDAKEFNKIQEAYNVLSDDKSRQTYDTQLNGVHVNVKFQDVFNDVFSDIHNSFDFNNTRTRRTRQTKNKNLQTSIECKLQDILKEQNITLSVRHIDGSRHIVKCAIPIGVENNSNIKYAGLGDTSISGVMPGDLFVNVKIKDHPRYVRVPKTIDIATDVTISMWDSILGCNVTIDSLEDKKLNVTIPAGVQYGTMLKVKGHGLANKFNDRGNIIVRVLIKTPQNLTNQQLNIIKGWQ